MPVSDLHSGPSAKDVLVTLSKTLEQMQGLKPGDLSARDASLCWLYIEQMGGVVDNAARAAAKR